MMLLCCVSHALTKLCFFVILIIKVRRVSFALPVKDDSCEDLQEKTAELTTIASHFKTSGSSPFTVVKQVRNSL